MGKQTDIIKNAKNQIKMWHIEKRPTDWIAKQLKVSRETLKKIYPDYKGNQGGHSIGEELEYDKTPKLCKQCNKPILWQKRKHDFCNHSCSAFFNSKNIIRTEWTAEQKNNFSKKQKERYKFLPKRDSNKTLKRDSNKTLKCIICNNEFTVKGYKIRKTCSKKCKNLLGQKLSRDNPNCGGETNYKRYIYNDITMDSSWEVNLAKYLDKNDIKWIRSRTIIFYWTDNKGNKRRYYPDFYLPELNVYLDPKNEYKLLCDKEKIQKVIKENNIKLITGSVENIINNLRRARSIVGNAPHLH